MNWLRRLWGRIRQWLFGKPRPTPLRTVRVEEQPEQVEPDTIYLVGEGQYLWFVVLLCPCGCRAPIQLNMLPQARPCWRVEVHTDGTVSLFPSVWRRQGCKSHFWVRRGRIEWCPAGTLENPGGLEA